MRGYYKRQDEDYEGRIGSLEFVDFYSLVLRGAGQREL